MSNLLYNSRGQLKLADFGLARLYGFPAKPMTPKVVTLWYRAPEILLGSKLYGPETDVWAAGCILGELISHAPLMPGRNEAEQIELIFKLLGTPDERTWSGVEALPLVESGVVSLTHKWQPGDIQSRFRAKGDSSLCFLKELLMYEPKSRISAQQALLHPFFKTRPYPQIPDFMPTWPTSHDRNISENQQGNEMGTKRVRTK